ncbi:unnamed protein product [Darwinula stevensoni]|uniref:Uncharacterized protein n=1 Tax=Darwinula stevensoni TaxID=69355 RepID=A0A7R9A9I4_9CRUS|nr:unnamed protein product [Darwinula stevensoni]CAG0897446.1 unnamed protein product [Darwinula stevensoni]
MPLASFRDAFSFPATTALPGQHGLPGVHVGHVGHERPAQIEVPRSALLQGDFGEAKPSFGFRHWRYPWIVDGSFGHGCPPELNFFTSGRFEVVCSEIPFSAGRFLRRLPSYGGSFLWRMEPGSVAISKLRLFVLDGDSEGFGNQTLKELEGGAFGDATFEAILLQETEVEAIHFAALLPSKDRLEALAVRRRGREAEGGLRRFPFRELYRLPRLAELVLRGNNFSIVLAFASPSLQRLDLEGNGIARLGSGWSMPNLSDLLLSENPLKRLPRGFLEGFPKLSRFACRGCELGPLLRAGAINLRKGGRDEEGGKEGGREGGGREGGREEKERAEDVMSNVGRQKHEAKRHEPNQGESKRPRPSWTPRCRVSRSDREAVGGESRFHSTRDSPIPQRRPRCCPGFSSSVNARLTGRPRSRRIPPGRRCGGGRLPPPLLQNGRSPLLGLDTYDTNSSSVTASTSIDLSANPVKLEEAFRPILEVLQRGDGYLNLRSAQYIREEATSVKCLCDLAWLFLRPRLWRRVVFPYFGACEGGPALGDLQPDFFRDCPAVNDTELPPTFSSAILAKRRNFRETGEPWNATSPPPATIRNESDENRRAREKKLSRWNWLCPYKCVPEGESDECDGEARIECGHGGCEEGEVCCRREEEGTHAVTLGVAGPVIVVVVGGLLALVFRPGVDGLGGGGLGWMDLEAEAWGGWTWRWMAGVDGLGGGGPFDRRMGDAGGWAGPVFLCLSARAKRAALRLPGADCPFCPPSGSPDILGRLRMKWKFPLALWWDKGSKSFDSEDIYRMPIETTRRTGVLPVVLGFLWFVFLKCEGILGIQEFLVRIQIRYLNT